MEWSGARRRWALDCNTCGDMFAWDHMGLTCQLIYETSKQVYHTRLPCEFPITCITQAGKSPPKVEPTEDNKLRALTQHWARAHWKCLRDPDLVVWGAMFLRTMSERPQYGKISLSDGKQIWLTTENTSEHSASGPLGSDDPKASISHTLDGYGEVLPRSQMSFSPGLHVRQEFFTVQTLGSSCRVRGDFHPGKEQDPNQTIKWGFRQTYQVIFLVSVSSAGRQPNDGEQYDMSDSRGERVGVLSGESGVDALLI